MQQGIQSLHWRERKIVSIFYDVTEGGRGFGIEARVEPPAIPGNLKSFSTPLLLQLKDSARFI